MLGERRKNPEMLSCKLWRHQVTKTGRRWLSLENLLDRTFLANIYSSLTCTFLVSRPFLALSRQNTCPCHVRQQRLFIQLISCIFTVIVLMGISTEAEPSAVMGFSPHA